MITRNAQGNTYAPENHKVSYLQGSKTKTTTAASLTPMRALRAKCLDCSGGSAMEVKYCVISECPLWVYRFGRRPENVEAKYLDPHYVKGAGLEQCCDQLVRECGDAFKGTQFYQESPRTVPTCPFERIDAKPDTLAESPVERDFWAPSSHSTPFHLTAERMGGTIGDDKPKF